MKRFWIIALSAIIIVIIGLLLSSVFPLENLLKSPQKTTQVNSLPSATATQVPVVTSNKEIIAQCRLLPVQAALISFSVPGVISEVLVKEGDAVKLDQPLARLANRAQAEAALASSELEVTNNQQALKNLQDGAYLATTQALKELNDAIMAVKSAKKALDKAKDDNESDEAIAQADANLSLARARQIEAQKKYDLLKDGPDPAQVAVAQKRLEIAQAKLAAAREALAALEIKAPFSGTIIRVTAQAGDYAMAGVPVLYLGNTTRWVVETIDLTELYIVNVKIGAAATIRFDALPEEAFSAVVNQISPYGQTYRGEIVYPVQITLDGNDPRLYWNMTCSASIVK